MSEELHAQRRKRVLALIRELEARDRSLAQRVDFDELYALVALAEQSSLGPRKMATTTALADHVLRALRPPQLSDRLPTGLVSEYGL